MTLDITPHFNSGVVKPSDAVLPAGIPRAAPLTFIARASGVCMPRQYSCLRTAGCVVREGNRSGSIHAFRRSYVGEPHLDRAAACRYQGCTGTGIPARRNDLVEEVGEQGSTRDRDTRD